jgi:excisionase family DNA binding protein
VRKGKNDLQMKLARELGRVRKRGEALNFTIAEVAELANVSTATLRQEVRRGRLRFVRIGRRILIPRMEVARLVGLEE